MNICELLENNSINNNQVVNLKNEEECEQKDSNQFLTTIEASNKTTNQPQTESTSATQTKINTNDLNQICNENDLCNYNTNNNCPIEVETSSGSNDENVAQTLNANGELNQLALTSINESSESSHEDENVDYNITESDLQLTNSTKNTETSISNISNNNESNNNSNNSNNNINDSDINNKSNKNELNYLINYSMFSSNSNNFNENNNNCNQNSSSTSNSINYLKNHFNQPNENELNNYLNKTSIDFGRSILLSSSSSNSFETNTVDYESNFDRIGPFEKLSSLCDNPTPPNIESASKYLVPALEFCAIQEDYMRVFSYLRKFCFYSDVLLRTLWLEQIQNIIQYLYQEGENIPIEFTNNFNMPNELALLISDLMQEPTYQIKKYATSSLICIIEKQLLDNKQIEKIIIPCLLNLVKENNEDFHIDCISLFGKLAPLIGRDLTTKYILEPFCRLCSSPVFHTRKACASNITFMANVVSTDDVEKYLLVHFCEFTKDQVWAIRKACADIFSQFAAKCSRKTREHVLTEYFIKLLDDNSRWVKISAYKSLGSFIATFSKDSIDNSIEHMDEQASNNQLELKLPLNETNDTIIQTSTKDRCDNILNKAEQLNYTSLSNSKIESIETNNELNHQQIKQNGEYTNFIYWRNSLPSLEDNANLLGENNSNSFNTKSKLIQDSSSIQFGEQKEKESMKIEEKNSNKSFNKSLLDLSQTSSSPSSPVSNISSIKSTPTEPIQINSKPTLHTPQYSQPINQTNSSKSMFSTGFITNLYSSTNSLSIYSNLKLTDLNQLSEELKQDVVPPILLCYFITMVEMNAQNSLDSEMNYNCAYNFPAIALTLGVSNWKYLRNLYKKLAEDNNWKVRQTLAYSIHELALILGTEITQNELVPIFDGYIKDVDEVRIGIVANLSKFLRVLSMDYRRSYMPKLNDFLKMDNQRNWRFRNELGLQIAEFCELFPTDCIAEYIQPITFTLALDKVSEVRLTAIKALTNILMQFELHKDHHYRRNFIEDVTRSFANNNKWSFRQLYVILCENILKEKAYVDLDSFSKDFLPKLLFFCNDKVPNIRVSLAKVISNNILTLNYFTSGTNPISNELDMALQYLNADTDSDVKIYLSYSPNPNEQTQLPPYEEVLNDKKTETNNITNDSSVDLNNKNISELGRLNDYQLRENEAKLNDNLNNLINSQLMNYEDSDETANNSSDAQNSNENNNKDNGDEQDDADEIIDTTKLSQLKIVSMDVEEVSNDCMSMLTDTTKHNDATKLLIKNSDIQLNLNLPATLSNFGSETTNHMENDTKLINQLSQTVSQCDDSKPNNQEANIINHQQNDSNKSIKIMFQQQ